MIFPGMDPYLEDPYEWQGFHNSLAVYMRELLQPLLLPRYAARLDERVFVEAAREREYIPDLFVLRKQTSRIDSGAALADEPLRIEVPSVEIRENFIEIVNLRDEKRVVTIIEIASPTNKYAGVGRASYLAKQADVLASATHLIEIDLLRAGPHVLAVPEWRIKMEASYDYLVCVSRALGERKTFEVYPRLLRERLPRVRVPLAGDDEDVVLDLQAAVVRTYEAGGYRDMLDYQKPCRPALAPEDQSWADELIRSARRPT